MKHALLACSVLLSAALTALAPGFDRASDEWVQIGVVGVDSGQIVVLDPSYFDSEWVGKDEGNDWQVQYWGRDEAKLEPEFGKSPIKCKDSDEATALDQRIQAYCKKHGIMAVTWKQSGSTYDKCAALTTGEKGYGQLNYQLGHAGLGVVATAGYGDGIYPVYARRNKEGVLVELRIMFDAEGEGAKRMKELIERQKKADKDK